MAERRFSEDELIAEIFAPLAGEGAFGLRDDAALLPLGGAREIVVTTDALVAGVHFFPDDPPGLVAKKALRANLSDLAAKAAEPLGFLLTLSLPPDWTNGWTRSFAAGLAEDVREFACPLLGGDTTATPGPLTISIAAFGRATRFVSRSGARPGDRIFVSGTIGDAALGLGVARGEAFAERLGEGTRAHLLDRYRLPQPRLPLIATLREHASAAMDVSDGLAGDLAKLLRASGVSGLVELGKVPLSAAAREAIALVPELLSRAVTGGDDYEILCCASVDAAPALALAAGKAGVALAEIGVVTAGAEPLQFLDSSGSIINFSRLSFSHF
ncbi:thiamine-phosphate kinase [Methylosinus sp. KRF6]|uniref:thiamine-phosphate kinase n=1 Tax=Methylosinus sp. KRF6 TaxID=2846853 RepID=UPI001C0DBF4F|nr:thiamine-phosphate kinase [Methylosinus sp. KRF6]MBU3890080.1 thiamine-phosphate kinase [Methylosinus sp. KRF6]